MSRVTYYEMQRRTVGGYFRRLPYEILHDIALTLPFTSIKQLRRTSKFWYDLLTNPNFVNLHLTQSLQRPPGNLFTPYYNSSQECNGTYIVEQSMMDDQLIISTSKIWDCYRWNGFQSSGGLICSYSSKSNCFRIFNPHIGEQVHVPGLPKFRKSSSFRHWFFCYSPSTKEYKILQSGLVLETGCFGAIEFAVTTLGSNTWRNIQVEFFSLSTFDDNPATECQGNLFWIDAPGLFSFDFISEKFHHIRGPKINGRPSLDYYSRMHERLISMGDTIGYVLENKLFALQDKTKGIWINKFDFPIPDVKLYRNARFTSVSEDGSLFGFMEKSSKVFSHDMGRRVGFRFTKIDGLYVAEKGRNNKGPKWVEYIGTHVRSLVSPVRIMEIGRRLNRKRKWVFDRLNLGDDATEDDLLDRVYRVLNNVDEDRATTSSNMKILKLAENVKNVLADI